MGHHLQLVYKWLYNSIMPWVLAQEREGKALYYIGSPCGINRVGYPFMARFPGVPAEKFRCGIRQSEVRCWREFFIVEPTVAKDKSAVIQKKPLEEWTEEERAIWFLHRFGYQLYAMWYHLEAAGVLV